MKATILSGLIAVALGGLTSCSNILEENGVINNVAESGMGELRIKLVADGSVNVTTKGDINENKKYDNLLNEFRITLTKQDGSQIAGLPNNTKFEELDDSYTVPKANTYKLTATYTSMGESVFAWDKPEFSGITENISVDGNTTKDVTAECFLTNSIININTNSLGEDITINSLYLSTDGNNTNKLVLIGEEKEDAKELGTNTVFVKAGCSPKLTLNATLKPNTDSEQNFVTTSDLISNSGNTAAKTQYNVAFQVSTDNGQVKIKVSINGVVDEKSVTFPVDPYKTNTPQS